MTLSRTAAEGRLAFRGRPSVSGKTTIWEVVDSDGIVLGEVRWNVAWRCYRFEQRAELDSESAKTVEDFVRTANEERAMQVTEPCRACDGDGWTVDVEPGHAPDCTCYTGGVGSTCPVPVQVQVKCERCNGEGVVSTEREASDDG